MEPSFAQVNWTHRDINTTTSGYVYTRRNGVYALWRNTALGGIASIPPGERIGGVAHWTVESFRTGKEFVYAVNNLGLTSFWRSETQSNIVPDASLPQWQWLNDSEKVVSTYIYTIINGSVEYYMTDSTNRAITWRRQQNAWIGATDPSSSKMIHHWYSQATYANGDIVVYGTSMLNTFRYFRLREGVDPRGAVGINPFSDTGSVSYFWEPINPLYEFASLDDKSNLIIFNVIKNDKGLSYLITSNIEANQNIIIDLQPILWIRRYFIL